MARTAKQKAAWRSKKKNYCVSAGAPGYGMKIQRCFKGKKNAQNYCKFYKERGNRCKVITRSNTAGRRCLKWSKPR